MSKTDIWYALDLIRNEIIQGHVHLNNAMDQMEKLKEAIQPDLEAEAKQK